MLGVGSEVLRPVRNGPSQDGIVLQLVGALVHELQILQRFPKELGELLDAQSALRTRRPGPMMQALQADEERRLKIIVGKLRALAEDEFGRARLVDLTPDDGTLDYSTLNSRGVSALVDDRGLLDQLPDDTRADLEDAVRALARGIPTGAAMLALRAAEGMVRHTHSRLHAAPGQKDDWFNLADEIVKVLPEGRAETRALEAYLSFLRNERNRAQHPGTRFTTREGERAVMNVAQAAVLLLTLKRAEKG